MKRRLRELSLARPVIALACQEARRRAAADPNVVAAFVVPSRCRRAL